MTDDLEPEASQQHTTNTHDKPHQPDDPHDPHGDPGNPSDPHGDPSDADEPHDEPDDADEPAGSGGGLLPPSEYRAPGEEWPYGHLADDAPKEARLVRGIVARINRHAHKRGESPFAISRSADIGYETLYKLLRGETYPNLVTIARLEKHFNRRLWGNEHLPRGKNTPPPTPPEGWEP